MIRHSPSADAPEQVDTNRQTHLKRGLSRYCWLAFLLIVLHLLSCQLAPNEQWLGPCFTATLAFLCGIYSARQISISDTSERRSWIILTLLFAIWSAAWVAVATLSSLIVTPWPSVHLDNVLMAARIAPLILLLAEDEIAQKQPVIALMDQTQMWLAIATMTIFFFPEVLGSSGQDFAMALVYRNAVNVTLFTLGLFNLLAWRRSPARRPRIALSILIMTYTGAALYINFAVTSIEHANPLSLPVYALLDCPFLLFLIFGDQIKLGHDDINDRFSIRFVGPSIMAVIVTACSMALSSRNLALGLAISITSIAIYGSRSSYVSFIQQRQQKRETAAALRKVDFLADMNHEIRNPLGHIALSASMLVNHSLTKEQGAVLIKGIHRSSEKIIDLLRDMLEISRLDAAMIVPNFQSINPADVIKRSYEEVLAFANEVDVKLHLEPLRQELSLSTDPKRLQQILVNLLINAIRHTPSQGQVCIRPHFIESVDPHFYIDVVDNGVGMAAHDVKNLFERFRQGPPPVHGDVGSGLGLSISKELAELIGARFEVESEVNRGTRFSVILPLYTTAERRMVSPASA